MNSISQSAAFKSPVESKAGKGVPAEDKPGVPNKSNTKKIREGVRGTDMAAS